MSPRRTVDEIRESMDETVRMAERMNERLRWDRAIASIPDGWFGPRVEPRWPDRWRAWAEKSDGSHSVSAWGGTESEALDRLADRMELERVP